MSHVICHMSHVIFFIKIFFYKGLKQNGGGSVINNADPVYYYLILTQFMNYYDTPAIENFHKFNG